MLLEPASLASVVEWARDPARPTLLGVDVGLGLPKDAVSHGSFREWLRTGPPLEQRVCDSPEAWSPMRCFFRVPKGKGGLTQFASRVALRRQVDVRTGAKSVFITAGIPGSVGTSCQQLWSELRGDLGRRVHVWPFDGPLPGLLAPGAVVIAETYPSFTLKRVLGLGAKSSPEVRRQWLRLHARDLPTEIVRYVERSEDLFDALVGVQGLQRVADRADWSGLVEPHPVEGGMLVPCEGCP